MQKIIIWFLCFSTFASNGYASPNAEICTPTIKNAVVVLEKNIEPVWIRKTHISDAYVTPDAPVAAYRIGDKTCLNITHNVSARVCGKSLFDLNHSAEIVYRSPENPEFPLFDYRNWLFSPYVVNDKTLVALAHSEWYDCLKFTSGSPLSCKIGNNQSNSWSNAISAYQSDDAGKSWKRTGIVQSFDYYPSAFANIWPHKMINFGFFHPSNIIRDGNRYYAFANYTKRDPNNAEPTERGMILLSTADILRGKWEQLAANGEFSVQAHNGMVVDGTTNWNQANVSWNSALCQYLILFWDGSKSRLMSTTTPSLANIKFSQPQEVKNQLILQIAGNEHLGFAGYNYPTAHFDPNSRSANFETTGKDFFVFTNSFNAKNIMERDIYRISAHIEDYQ